MSLEIIMGPMFSGKTTHAISFIRRQKFIGSNVLAIKPQIDLRYSTTNVIISHDKDIFRIFVEKNDI
jgi:thymidine kinase